MKKNIPIIITAAAITATMASSVSAADYTVKSGDTLWSISVKTNATVSNLMTWNNLKDSTLSIGQNLKTSAPEAKQTVDVKTYKVVAGDTLWAIATKHNVAVNDIITWNKLTSTTLKVGQELSINGAVSNVAYITKTSGLFKSQGKERVSLVAPQRVTVLERGADGWLQIQTWLGPLWVKDGVTEEVKPPVQSNTYIVSKPSALFKTPGKDRVSSITPQRVTVLETGSDGWIKIQTWLGPLWLKEGVMEEVTANTVKTAVTTGNLNLRQTASASGALILTMPSGANVKVLESNGTWWKVEYNGKVGFASSEYLKMGEPLVVVEKARTTANLYFRTQPSSSATAITILPVGTTVTVIGKSGAWWNIEHNGQKGYASSEYLQLITQSQLPSNGKIVVLDPGHGGVDPGAINGNIREKDIVLNHSLKTKGYLEAMGYTVHMTRTGDTTCVAANNLGSGSSRELDCRVKFAEAKNADIFVSVHANSFLPGVRGTETFYNNGSTWNGGSSNPYPAESGRLASSIHNKYQPAFGSSDRKVQAKNYYVNNNAKMPSVLLEIGFMSDVSDLNKLLNPTVQERVSKAIADGIHDHLK